MASVKIFIILQKRLFILPLISFLINLNVQASAASACDISAEFASKKFGVLSSIMKEITGTETGGTRNGALEPWTWAVHVGGQGYWFNPKFFKTNHAKNYIKADERNIDIDCFQLNYRWNGSDFSSTSDMFDPKINTRRAVDFLLKLYQDNGDRMREVDAYHSRTQEHAAKCKNRFLEVHANLWGDRSKGSPAAELLVHPTGFHCCKGAVRPHGWAHWYRLMKPLHVAYYFTDGRGINHAKLHD